MPWRVVNKFPNINRSHFRRKLRNNYGRLDEDSEGDGGWSAFSKNPIYRGDKVKLSSNLLVCLVSSPWNLFLFFFWGGGANFDHVTPKSISRLGWTSFIKSHHVLSFFFVHHRITNHFKATTKCSLISIVIESRNSKNEIERFPSDHRHPFWTWDLQSRAW